MGVLPAKRRLKSTKKKTRANKSNSRKKTTKKKVVKKRIVQKAVRKRSARKTAKKIPTRKKAVKKTTTKKASPQKKTTRRQASNTSNDRKFAMLLKEIRNMKDHTFELAQGLEQVQIEQQRQHSKTIQQTVQQKEQNSSNQTQEQLVEKNNQAESKDKLLSKIKDILSSNKKADLTTEEPVKKEDSNNIQLTEKEKEIKLFTNMPAQKIEPHPIQMPKPTAPEKREDFQATRSRGVVSLEEVEQYSILLKQMIFEVDKVFIGQENVVEKVILSLMCDAHTLLEGVPGLAKSLLVEVLRRTIDGTTFERIQFLPDLLPSDIIGGQIFNPKTSQFVTHKGPIFANFVLADEINRAPPKTHAAIMEAMQEKKINIENDVYILDRPFLVLATQNPLENKGTYELPEAVLDRFMFKVMLNYPKREDEMRIITENATTKKNINRKVKAVLDKEKLLEIQSKVRQVFISEKIREYILDLVSSTRADTSHLEGVKFLQYGAGVRASIYLGVAAKAKALLEGRNYVLPDDVAYVLPDVFRHRLKLNYRGKAHNISAEKIIEEILSKVNAV